MKKRDQEIVARLFNLTEISELLGVSQKTIYYWVHRREIPFTRVGKHLRFSAPDVIAYFQRRTGDAGVPCPSTSPLLQRTSLRSFKTRREGLAENRSQQWP